MSKIKDGEYVLGTRFSDGHPRDPWAFGFLKRLDLRNQHGRRYSSAQYYYAVVDGDGRAIGRSYARVQRITKDFGDWLAKNINLVETSDRSLWWWKKNYQIVSNYYKMGGRP